MDGEESKKAFGRLGGEALGHTRPLSIVSTNVIYHT